MRKSNLQEFKDIARKNSGYCLSKVYVNAKTKLKLKCKNGHVWTAYPDNLKRGHWCQRCSAKIAARARAGGSLKDLTILAKSRDGTLLSKTFVSFRHKYDWRCNEGHKFKASASDVKSGRWCRLCGIASSAEKRSSSIDKMQEIARSRGGLCLSAVYKNNKTKLLWQCEKGHKFQSAPGTVLSGGWCFQCGRINSGIKQRGTITEMRAIARKRGGDCLSKEYVSASKKLQWKCSKNHIWFAVPGSVVAGTWCPECAGNTVNNIDAPRTLAKQRGGECLSSEYSNAHTPLKWRCLNGHTWLAPYSRINNGAWCPDCKISFGEAICRLYFEKMFGKPFPKLRPNWLRSENGYPLELDGYNQKLGIAFEHQGEHHYGKSFFTKSKGLVNSRRNADNIKKKECRKRKIALIVIPEIGKKLPLEKMNDFIATKLTAMNIKVPRHVEVTKLDISSIYKTDKLSPLRQIASEKGGRCLSKHYMGQSAKLKFKCHEGHIWDALPANVKRGSWCPICAVNNRRKK